MSLRLTWCRGYLQLANCLSVAIFWALMLLPHAGLAAPSFCPPSTSTDLTASTLRIGVKYAPPFVMMNSRSRWQGFAVELWETMALCLPVRFEYVEYADTDGLIDALAAGEVDLAVGAISITSERARRVDFSQPFHTGLLGVVVPDVEPARSLTEALHSFARSEVLLVVSGLLLVTTLIAHVYWRVDGAKGHAFFREGPGSGLYNATIWAVRLVFAGHGDPFEHRTRAGQLFVLFLTFFGATMVSGVTAIITSSLTLQGIENRIRSEAQLKKQPRLAVMVTGPARDWAREEGLYVQQLRAWPEVQRQLDDGTISAFAHDREILQYLVKERFLTNVRVEPLTFRPDAYGFALRKGSGLRENLDLTLLALKEDRAWQVIHSKYLDPHDRSTP